jgi:hypothetical protein
MNYPNYLQYAAMILTANKLGIDAPCVSMAERIWSDKSMPEPIFLGTLAKAATQAQQLVLSAGLGEEADQLACNLLTNDKFE